MIAEPILEHLEAEITLKHTCGNCRRFPGSGQVCEERGRPVRRNNTAKRYCYDPMTPGELQAKQREYFQRPEVKAKQREYSQRPEVKAKKREYFQRPEVKAKQREKRQTKAALKALEKLKTANPQLYEKLLREASE